MLKDILKFLNLLDHKENLSLSNISLIASMVMSFINPPVGIAALVTSVLNYMHKRSVNNSAAQGSEEAIKLKDALEAVKFLEEEVNKKVARQADEVQNMLTAANIGQGLSFTRRNRQTT